MASLAKMVRQTHFLAALLSHEEQRRNSVIERPMVACCFRVFTGEYRLNASDTFSSRGDDMSAHEQSERVQRVRLEADKDPDAASL